jgi:hypothetical protein
MSSEKMFDYFLKMFDLPRNEVSFRGPKQFRRHIQHVYAPYSTPHQEVATLVILK